MADVSRETVPEPDAAVVTAVFAPSRLPLLARYAELLATDGVVRGVIGPREVARIWDRHLVNCGLLAGLIEERATVVDLGSGGGLPGVVLATARPDLRVTLVEPMERRTTFLGEVVAALGLENVEVVRGRADALAGPAGVRYDVVTARALAALPTLLGWALPLVASDGQVLAMKGAAAATEVEEARPVLDRWGARAEVVPLAVPGATPTTVVRVVAAGASGIGWQATGANPPRRGARGRSTRRRRDREE
jgi:16S rRNA (guanine527-N7)-methyltransferase